MTAAPEVNAQAEVGARPAGAIVSRCRLIIDSERFQFFIVGVIIVNAISLGMYTFGSVEQSLGPTLALVDTICLVIYVVELVIRIISYGRDPADFFKSGWNIFDLVVIGSVFVPGLSSQTAILRVLRVLRLLRRAAWSLRVPLVVGVAEGARFSQPPYNVKGTLGRSICCWLASALCSAIALVGERASRRAGVPRCDVDLQVVDRLAESL